MLRGPARAAGMPADTAREHDLPVLVPTSHVGRAHEVVPMPRSERQRVQEDGDPLQADHDLVVVVKVSRQEVACLPLVGGITAATAYTTARHRQAGATSRNILSAASTPFCFTFAAL